MFPSDFAKAMLADCDLWPKVELHSIEDRAEKEFWMRVQKMIAEFQKMSLFSSFDVCLRIFHGMGLDEEQVRQLQMIHAITKEWAKGHIALTMMDKMKADGRYAQGIGSTLLEHLHGLPGESSGSSGVKKLVLKAFGAK